MIIRFGVENHYSIRDYQEISFVAAPYKEHHESLIRSTRLRGGLLPVVVMYGANASGKSNMISAFSRLVAEIDNSFTSRKPDAEIRHNPFKLDEESVQKPTRMDCDFILDEVRYHYGFAFDAKRIVEEWLYAYPKGSRQVWFHRKGEGDIYFGKELKGPNKEVERLTRPNSLLLSAGAQGNHPELTRLYEFFTQLVVIRMSPEINEGTIAEYLKDSVNREMMLNHVRNADFGICDARVKSQAIDPASRSKLESLMKLMTADTVEVPLSDLEKYVTTKIELGHSGEDGKVRFLRWGDESMGTRQFMSILGPIVRALRRGNLVLLDEVTTGLHTLLSQQLIKLFTSKSTNPRGAQLIFSTHDTNLLNTKLIRRDEVWLVEKMGDGSTSIYPLSDIRTKPTDNLEKGYIQGRFGAIPVFGADGKMMRSRAAAE